MISREQFFDKILPYGLVAFLFVTHLIVALGTELAHDEAYYWLYSQKLDWGYFDHPPMVAWLIKLTSWLGGEIGVRLSFIIGLVGSGLLLQSLIPKENKWLLWLGINLFPLIGFSGAFALPDGALVIFSATWIWALKKSFDNEGFLSSILLAMATACLFYSKYHGIFYLLATIAVLPHLIFKKYFWLTALMAFALYFPHVFWQWEHDFSTFRYHFVDRPKIEIGFKQPLEFIAVNFIIMGLLVSPFFWRQFIKRAPLTSFEKSLKAMTVLILTFFLYSTLSKKMEANWTVAAGISLLVFVCMKPNNLRQNKIFQILSVMSLVIIFTAKVVLVFPGIFPLKRIAEFHGWKNWALEIEKNNPDCVIAANRYQYASKLSFYLGKDISALNVRSRRNQFDYWDRSYMENKAICWVAEQDIFPSEAIDTPTGQKLTIVKGVPFELIMSYKGI